MTTPTTPQPADFGDRTALNLGEYTGTGTGTIDMAIERVRAILDGLSAAFGTTSVQFNFNGTPAVMRVKDTPREVLVDWSTRRTAYQVAAGILTEEQAKQFAAL